MSDVFRFESVPPKLVEREQWVCWRYEQRGNKKPPYDPENDERASTQNPETWTDFETAIETYRASDYDGIGFILTEDDPITGFDFDGCRDPETGEIDYKYEVIINCLDSYSEVSPSGTGLHSLIIGEKPKDVGSRSGDGLEVYDSNQYFTFTGDHIDSTPETIEERSTELRAICEAYLTPKGSGSGDSTEELPDDVQDDDAIKQAQDYIRDFMHGQETGSRAREYYSDLLKCKYSKRGFGDDRSAAETTLCTLTYGILLDGGADPDEARSLTYQYVTHAARENPRTEKGGEIRKWFEGPPRQQRNYRQNTLDYAIRNFDPEIWNLWRLSGKDKTTNDYSEHAYQIVLNVLHDLTVERDLLSPPPPCLLIITHPQGSPLGVIPSPDGTQRWKRSWRGHGRSTS